MIMIVMTHAMVVVKNELYQDIVMIILATHNAMFVTVAEQFHTSMASGMLLNKLLALKVALKLESVVFVLKQNLIPFLRLVIIFQPSGQ